MLYVVWVMDRIWVLDQIVDWSPVPCCVYLVLHLMLKLILEPADLLLQALNLSAQERDGGGALVLGALRRVLTPTPAQVDRQMLVFSVRTLIFHQNYRYLVICYIRLNL